MVKKYSSKKRRLPYADWLVLNELKSARRAAALANANTFNQRTLTDNVDPLAYRKKQLVERRANRGLYTGRGGFWSSLEGAADRFLRKGIPRLLGAAGQVKKFMGRGAYEDIHSNNLIMTPNGTQNLVPHMQAIGDETGAIVVRHREFISDIYGPSSTIPFYNQSFPLNPGLQNIFPWLSQIAQNYEEYEFIQLIFTFRSTVSDIATTNGQIGNVIMATNYNANAQPFSDKNQMMDYAHAHSCKLTEHMEHGVECDPSKNAGSAGKYIRLGPIPSGQDLKTYDQGIFQIALANVNSNYNNLNLGELYVEYTVKLSKPRLSSSRGSDIEFDVITAPAGTTIAASKCSFSKPFGDSSGYSTILYGQYNTIGTKLSVSSAGVMTLIFPASFVGYVKIELILALREAVQTSGQFWFNVNKAGNVKIENVSDSTCPIGVVNSSSSGDCSWRAVTNDYFNTATALGAGNTFSAFYIANVYAPASGGADNIVTLTAQNVNLVAKVWPQIIISQINPTQFDGKFSKQFISPSTGAIVDPVSVTTF